MAADLAQEGMCQLNAFEGDGASESVSGELLMRRGDEEGEGECEGCGSGAVFKSVLGRPTLLRPSVYQLLRFTALRAGSWEGDAVHVMEKRASPLLLLQGWGREQAPRQTTT